MKHDWHVDSGGIQFFKNRFSHSRSTSFLF